ncbi:hypothetical protein ACGYK1_15970 [Sulfitobacter sp. 1A13191]
MKNVIAISPMKVSNVTTAKPPREETPCASLRAFVIFVFTGHALPSFADAIDKQAISCADMRPQGAVAPFWMLCA